MVKEGSRAQIECSHDDTSLILMFWYQQRTDGSSLALIVHGYETQSNYEGDFEKQGFTLKRKGTVKGTLEISTANQSHSAVYFCAASTQ